MNNLIADPVKASEIMSLLNVDPAHLNIPTTYRKVQEVVNFFSEFPNMRYYVLKVTSGKPGDKLDSAWNYVALQKEREAILDRFEASDFAPDIEDQLKDKYLTKDNIARIRTDVDQKKQIIAEREKNRAQTAEIRKNQEQAVKKINLNEVESNLNDLEKINELIDRHG